MQSNVLDRFVKYERKEKDSSMFCLWIDLLSVVRSSSHSNMFHPSLSVEVKKEKGKNVYQRFDWFMMEVPPAIQARFERDLLWKSSWPRSILALIASLEIPLGMVNRSICLFLSNDDDDIVDLVDFSNWNSQYSNGRLAFECFRWILGLNDSLH